MKSLKVLALFGAVFAGLAASCSRTVSTLTLSGGGSSRNVSSDWEALDAGASGNTAVWRERTDSDGTRSIVVTTSNGDEAFNVLLSKASYGPNVDIAVRLRADSGAIDQGGGLVWRAKDGDNYYVTRWNPLERNFRLYRVVDGVRKQLASAEADLDPRAWHDLQVTMVGASILVMLDSKVKLTTEDTTFADAGRIGLWTKADASTSFSVPVARTIGN